MHKITLVCSAHRENGLCKAEELLNIFEATAPDIVFGEFRPSEFDYVLDYADQTSQEYRRLNEENDKSVHQLGFKY